MRLCKNVASKKNQKKKSRKTNQKYKSSKTNLKRKPSTPLALNYRIIKCVFSSIYFKERFGNHTIWSYSRGVWTLTNYRTHIAIRRASDNKLFNFHDMLEGTTIEVNGNVVHIKMVSPNNSPPKLM